MSQRITEAVIKSRLEQALKPYTREMHVTDTISAVEEAYTRGAFHEFVDAEANATKAERARAAATCRRMGHSQTARLIQEGK